MNEIKTRFRSPHARITSITGKEIPDTERRQAARLVSEALAWPEAGPLFQSLADETDDKVRAQLREYLIEGHRRLAFHVVMRFSGIAVATGEPMEDLVQVALIGLVHAVDRFQPAAGVRFSTFAVVTIQGELARYIRDRGSLVRLTRRQQELSSAARRLTEALWFELGRCPTYTEIAERLNVTEEAILTAIAAAESVRMPRSLESSPLQGKPDATTTFHDLLGQYDPAMTKLLAHGDLHEALLALPKPERKALLLRFGTGLSQRAVAEHLGISQMQVSRMERRALEKMRHGLQAPVSSPQSETVSLPEDLTPQ